MHRSGTSAVVGYLSKLGITLGSKLMLPNEYNEKGYFENDYIVEANDHILQTLGSSWDDLFLLEDEWWRMPQLIPHADAVKKIIRQEFSTSELFCIKDPRISILLPFWIGILRELNIEPFFIIPLRHPLEVAESLKTRDGFTIQKGLLLWMNNMLSIEYYSRPSKRIFLKFDDFLTYPTDTIHRILNQFHIDFPNAGSPFDVIAKELLDPKLKHHNIQEINYNGDMLSLIDRFYAILLHVHNSKEIDENDLMDIDKIRGEYKRLSSIFYNRDIRNVSMSLKETSDKLNGQIAGLNQAIAASDEQIGNLTAELQEAKDKLQSLINSNSWRLTVPLREMRRWFTAPNRQGERYRTGILRLTKSVYQDIPLSHQTKVMHRKVMAKFFPKLLLISDSLSAQSPEQAPPVFNETLLLQCTNPAEFAKTIEIPAAQAPQVSVIIPVYGQINYTLCCLASIAAHPQRTTFEIIVVDDCSPDHLAEILSGIQGIRLLINEKNLGFIRSCNRAAAAAKGEYICFLNNDTQVTAGWLDELLRTFREFPGAGLAGSKLIYPDGKLQEAGGIIWQDGSAWNFGRFENPMLPVYNYAREVDYCSGAAIMVPKTLFNELGGFDEHYLPAYCEDADLALKIRDRGYRVIYQPLSVVFHFEGITQGTDTNSGVKAHQVENQNKLFQRWQNRLKDYQANGKNLDKAKDRRAKRRVLVIDLCTPTPDQDSGSIDAFNFVLLLREMDFQVTFIPEDNFLFMPKYTPALQRTGVEMLYAPYVTSVGQHLKEYGFRYDLVFMFRFGCVQRNIQTVRKYCKKAKVLFNTVDLNYLRLEREAALLNDSEKMKAARETQHEEYTAIRAADVATVVSAEELKILQSNLPDAKICLMPFSRNIAGTEKGYADRRDMVFVGGYQHPPNIDAVQYFIKEIMPLLRPQLPGVRFYAVGSKPPADIKALACEDIIITGFVEELTPLLDKMRISVAPLRYGAGIKGKIGSAMAVGLPVVTTPLGAEGMALTDGENIVIADGAVNFADAIIRLYNDEELWNRLSSAGIAFAERTWGSEAGWNTLVSILRQMGFTSVQRKYPVQLYTEYRIED